MYERSYGYRYAELGDHPSAADIAKAMRADVKRAVSEGLLPAAWSYSVTSESFAGGRAVNLDVRDCPDAYELCDGGAGCRNVWCAARNDPRYAHGAGPHHVLTAVAEAAKMTLERIHNAYNHDGSELQVDYHDVRYYGHVEFETLDGYAFRMQERQRLEERKRAREGGRIVGRVRNYKRDGGQVTHVLVETTDGRKALACGARSWRGSLLSRVADDAEVTCSRCAKRFAAATREP
jgi:hypothetical protein